VMAIGSVPLVTVTNYLAKKVSHHLALEEPALANQLILTSYKWVLRAALGVALVVAVFPHVLGDILQLPSVVPVFFLCAAFVANAAIPVNIGLLQGLHRFGLLSFFSVGYPALKLLLAVLALYLGWELNGVMGAITVSALVAVVATFLLIRPVFAAGFAPTDQEVRHVWVELWPLFLGNTAFSLISQLDMVLVKSLFDPHQAGIYSSAAILSKALMYLPGALVMSLFPMVAASKAKQESSFHLLLKALGLTLLLSGSGAVVLYFFPEWVVGFLFGNKFLEATSLIPTFVVAILPVAFLMVLMTYNLAWGGRLAAPILALGAGVQALGFYLFHESLAQVLWVMFFVNLGTAGLSLGLAYLTDRIHRQDQARN